MSESKICNYRSSRKIVLQLTHSELFNPLSEETPVPKAESHQFFHVPPTKYNSSLGVPDEANTESSAMEGEEGRQAGDLNPKKQHWGESPELLLGFSDPRLGAEDINSLETIIEDRAEKLQQFSLS